MIVISVRGSSLRACTCRRAVRERIRANLALHESGDVNAPLSPRAERVFRLLTGRDTDYTEHLDLLK